MPQRCVAPGVILEAVSFPSSVQGTVSLLAFRVTFLHQALAMWQSKFQLGDYPAGVQHHCVSLALLSPAPTSGSLWKFRPKLFAFVVENGAVI